MAEPHSFAETDAVQKLARKLKLPLELRQSPLFLQKRADFQAWAGKGQGRLLMENHYRRMRKATGWLMEPNGEPAGGAWNYDVENRETLAAWHKTQTARPAVPLRQEPDELTREVIALVEREFPEHPGRAADFWLPVDRAGGPGVAGALHPRAAAALWRLRGHHGHRRSRALSLGAFAAAEYRAALTR